MSADPTSVTFAGSGRTSVRTPPRYRGLRLVDVDDAPTAPDADGRVRFTVDLGPPNAAQQYTPGATTTVTRRTVSLEPHAVIRITRATRTARGIRVCARAIGGELPDARIRAGGVVRRAAIGARTRCRVLPTRRASRVTIRGHDRFGHAATATVRVRRTPVATLAKAVEYRSSVRPLSPYVRGLLKRDTWRPKCPVPLSGLRLLTVTHRGFDGRPHTGNLVVNATAARPLARVFRKLYALRFPIRHMSIADVYGPTLPKDGDLSGSFECREAVPSPCDGGTGTGSWSMHAYGLAVDLNTRENPYVGCGQSRDPRTRKYFDRKIHRKGMVTKKVVAAFRSIGWGWGGNWTGNTKDYMHFSATGH